MDLYAVRNELAAGRSLFELPLRVTYYARVSTDSCEQLHSLQAQSSYFSGLINDNPRWQYLPGYIDEGISGTAVKKRLSFLQMMEDARAGLFDLIVTKEVSRFARNTLDSIRYTQELLSLGVGVFFQSDNINTLLPDSELRLTIMASVAQDEVRKTSERVRFGFRRAIENGVVLGSDRIWGYRKDNGKLVVVEEEACLVRRIFELYACERMGMRSIARKLNEEGKLNSNGRPFGYSTIAGILENPKYKGFYCGNKTHKLDYKLDKVKTLPPEDWVLYPAEEKVPPIVGPELWEKAAQLRRSRSRKYSGGNTTNRYPFSGKLICGCHQQPYYRCVYKYASGDKEVWQCRLYAQQGKAGCQGPVIYGSELLKITGQLLSELLPRRQELTGHLADIFSRASDRGQIMARKSGLLREQEEWRKRQDRLLDLHIAGSIGDEEFVRRNNGFNERLEQIDQQLAALSCTREDGSADLIPDKIRKAIPAELTDWHDPGSGLIDALLREIRVDKCSEGWQMAVYLQEGLAAEEEMPYARYLLQTSPRCLRRLA